MARAKAAALAHVPETEAEATVLLADYVAADRRMLELRLGYQVQIDRLEAERDLIVARMLVDQKDQFLRLKAWCEAGGRALSGKGRSAELAGAKVGVRLSTPAVKFAKGVTAAAIVDWLGRVVGGKAFLRTTVKLDKQAVIKAISGQKAMAGPLAEKGVTVRQADEFFIDTQLDEAAVRAKLLA